MTLTARPRFLIRFAVLAALALCGIVLALSSTGTPPVGAQDGSLPAKPTGVVTTATHDSVALAWDDPSDASITHYQIFRRDRDVHDTGEFVTIEENTGSAAASYTDDTVEPETRYVYRVKAVNQHGASTWSTFARADTPAAPDPADLAPSGLEVSLVENRVTLTWDAPASDAASVTGYEILRRRPNDGEAALTTLVANTGNAETGYTDDSANEPGVSYTYRVKALRDGEQSKVSNYDRIDLPDDYVQDTPEPEEEPSPEALAPSGLTAEAAEDGGVALSWTAPAEDAGSVTGYEVLRAQGSAELATLEADTGNTDTTYTDSGVTGDLDGYRYQVKALRGGDASQGSNVAGVLQSAHAGAIVPLADVTLISNLGQSSAGSGDFTNDQAQAFTTGSNSGGYSLTKVVINSLLGLGADFTVSVHENDSGAPGTSLGTLTNPTLPATNTREDYEFTHSGIDLAASATYFIVVDVGASSTNYLIYNTSSDAEDTGGATGWSIGDSSLYRSQSSTGSWTTWAQSKRISMTGTVTAEVTGPGAALVSNVGQTAATGAAQVSTSQSQAQGFTTGSDSGGYTLGSVELAVSSFSGTASDITVSIYSESSGNPGTVVHTLTTPASISAAVTTFTAPSGTTLAASTTYYVVISTTSSGISLSRTDATAEDTGGASGWSIADSRRFFGQSGWNTTTKPIRMRVNGDAATSTNSPATGAPTITGTAQVGESLTADISNIGDADGIADADFEYQWIAFDGTDDSDISGATGETYRPLLAHLGQTIKVRVTFDDDDDNAESLTSAPTAAVTASTYGQVIWTATVTVGTDSASSAGFTVDSFGYFNHPTEGSFGAIDDSMFTHSGVNYTVSGIGYATLSNSGGLVSNKFSVVVNGSLPDSAGFRVSGKQFPVSEVTTTSTDAQGVVTYDWDDAGLTWTDGQMVEVRLTVNRAATGAPAITGTPVVGETLTADVSGIMDEDGLPAAAQFAYQWISNDGTDDSDIDGATDSTYTLVEADAGKSIKVRVSFTDDAKFPESLTSAAVTVPVAAGETALVSNMNQTTSGSASSTNEDGAQAFTTGTNSFGYTLESVQISLTVGGSPFPAHTVSIWTESSNNPGSSLGTLTNPDPVVNGVNTYTTTDGISLSAGTTYFIVVDNSPNAGDSGRMAVTGSDSEDSGAASGWSIGDGRVYRDHDSTGSWGIYQNSLKIRINGQVIVPPPEVPADSSLVPDGLGPGDQFQLIFLSSETRTAEATDIATYNTWVQGLAANGHTDIQDHSSTFRVVGSTAAVDARDNTSTTGTGVAIHWLNGDKAADDYEDFYDETWDEEASMRDESGTTVTAPTYVWTGSDDDGTTTNWHLGSNLGNVTVGIPNSTSTGNGPLSSGVANVITLDRHLYALSGVFQVSLITDVPADWSLVPSGLQEGDQFRLLFISSTSRNASPSEIATYNTWIQARAANGHTDIQDYSSSFRAVGSTEDMDARDNTGTDSSHATRSPSGPS